MKLITYEKAKEEIVLLQEFVDLVETYEADTLEKWVILEYAMCNNLTEVAKRANDKGFTTETGEPIKQQNIVNFIKSRPQDRLHRILLSGYMLRTRHSRNKKI